MIGGQNPRYTSYLIDGGQNTDLYIGGTVAGVGLPHSISPEAVAQVQVLAAPVDVRNGDFAGGAINIVTRSGTNAWHGSAFGFFQNDALVGTDAAGTPVGSFTSSQYGVTLSGPIVRNHLQFFLNADLQHAVTPEVGPFITDAAGGADMKRFGVQYESVASLRRYSHQHMASRQAGWAGVTPANPPAICSSSSVPSSEPTTSSSSRIITHARQHSQAPAAITGITALAPWRRRTP
jgi:outer membrane receptor for ferrienterochelin and colicin